MKVGICILAGGLSERMGREKGRVRIGRRTLLGHVRRVAEQVGLPVRVIRNDLVRRCGPLGGIYTALRTSRQEAEVFLSCDMPFVSAELIRQVLSAEPPVFVVWGGLLGFPLMIAVKDIKLVERQIEAARFSLQNLAKRLNANCLTIGESEARQLFNINTPADLEEARRRSAELLL